MSINPYRKYIVFGIALTSIVGFCYYLYFLMEDGYLPSPFVHDKADTFMDLFNPMHWAYNDDRYTDWGSVYPPLNFLILKFLNYIFIGDGYGAPKVMRENSSLVIVGFCLIYLAIPAVMMKDRLWRHFSIDERKLIYLAIIFSTPMLFALERANLIVLCPIFLVLVLSRVGFTRTLCIALLVNIKPYFAVLMLYYVVRKDWKTFVTCTALGGLVFVVSGLMLGDAHFFMLFSNIFEFSKNNGLNSPIYLGTMSSSISVFPSLFENLNQNMSGPYVLNRERIVNTIYIVESTQLFVLAISLFVLIIRQSKMHDAEILSLLTIVIINSGISVGSYTLILYAVLIPVIFKMRARLLYVALLTLVAMPLDIIPLASVFTGKQYSYLSDSYVNVQQTLGLGSVIRPIANLLILLTLSFEFLLRTEKSAPIED